MEATRGAAVAYAVESLHVQHIIILGHYGCKGIEMAITKSSKATRLVSTWVKRISDMYATSRRWGSFFKQPNFGQSTLTIFYNRQEIVRLRDSRLPQRGTDNGVKTPPPPDDGFFFLPFIYNTQPVLTRLLAGFRALVEENVKKGVKELRSHGTLTKANSFFFRGYG
jgi:carbonic anhydrase